MRNVPYSVKQRWATAAELRKSMKLVEKAFWRRGSDGWEVARYPDIPDLTSKATDLLNRLSTAAHKLEDCS